MTRLRPTAALVLIVGVMLLPACAPFSTQPPIESVESIPTYEPFPTLMAEAIRYTHKVYRPGDPHFAWNLPPGTTLQVYKRVGDRLQSGHPLEDSSEQAIHVASVRARGPKAEVDVILPRDRGVLELMTLSFENDLVDGWQVVRDRAWRIPQEAPAPSYPAALETQVVVEAEEDAGE